MFLHTVFPQFYTHKNLTENSPPILLNLPKKQLMPGSQYTVNIVPVVQGTKNITEMPHGFRKQSLMDKFTRKNAS